MEVLVGKTNEYSGSCSPCGADGEYVFELGRDAEP